MTETVGVVSRALLEKNAERWLIPGFSSLLQDGGFICNTTTASLLVTELNKHLEFLPRNKIEKNKNWKQVIPYIVVTQGSKVFTTRRLKKSSETRLHGKLSVGLGGHINPEDKNGDKGNHIWGCVRRELAEEVEIDSRAHILPIPVGIVNHDRNEVGSVHIGLVFHIELEPDLYMAVKETDQLEGAFQHWISLKPGQLELWAKMLWKSYSVFL